MEDAMIISKGSLDRGFAHGQIYKTEVRNKIDKYWPTFNVSNNNNNMTYNC